MLRVCAVLVPAHLLPHLLLPAHLVAVVHGEIVAMATGYIVTKGLPADGDLPGLDFHDFQFSWTTHGISTLGSCPESWPGRPCAALARPGEQHADLVLRVWVQVPNFVAGGVHGLPVTPAATGRAVLHLAGHDGPIAIDGVGIELDP